MVVECQATVKSDAEDFHAVRHRPPRLPKRPYIQQHSVGHSFIHIRLLVCMTHRNKLVHSG